MKILFASAEVVPFAKTGGLADVAGALPKQLAGMGHDVRIVMPRYGFIDGKKYGLHQVVEPFNMPHGHDTIQVSIEQSEAIEGVPTYFIRNDYLYNRENLYGQPDNDHRFVAYSRGMLEMLPHLNWKPDVIHCNDWHTGVVPVYLKTLYANKPGLTDIGTLFTIHNLAYQGSFDKNVMELAGLPWELFTWDKLMFWGQFNFLKAGLIYADAISTVSPTYAKEIQTKEFGEGLEEVITFRENDLYGILNGIDYSIWNPNADPLIPHNFTEDDLGGKYRDKHDLQKEMGLATEKNTPLFGLISRLSYQKGLDYLEAVLPDMLNEQDMQVVILGSGDEHYETMLKKLAKQHPSKLALALKFDDALAHRIYAGSDAFLMPSHYEPCGLGQMISMAYGTIPVVHATGGLVDTVKEFKANLRSRGNGFLFESNDPEDFQKAIHRAIDCYTNKRDCWDKAMENAFRSLFTWENSAKEYVKVYRHAVKKAAGQMAA